MMLSHSFRTGITNGFIKGTPSSDVVAALSHLRACARQAAHPLLLSIIILAHDVGPENDIKQRAARDWLRRLEHAVSMRDDITESESYLQDGKVPLDGLSRDLVECHSQVMWKKPQAYVTLSEEIRKSMDKFFTLWAKRGKVDGMTDVERRHRSDIDKLHRSLLSRIEFYVAKLKGLENYIQTSLDRLKLQREGVCSVPESLRYLAHMERSSLHESGQLFNIMSQREARLNLSVAAEQRRIAHASKRDGSATKTLSVLGALFLPGTYLASVFSMTFFNFQASTSFISCRRQSSLTKPSPTDATPVVSVQLWIYFALTIPITAIILVAWLWWDRRREAQHVRDDADLENNIDEMEKEMLELRLRTMSKVRTWTSTTTPPRP